MAPVYDQLSITHFMAPVYDQLSITHLNRDDKLQVILYAIDQNYDLPVFGRETRE